MPSRARVKRLAAYFGVPEWKIWGTKNDKDEITLAKEFLTGAMGSDVVDKLTDDQILSAYRVAMATAKAMLAS